jgi:transcriptional regulator with XRE-family HTH domain
MDPEFGLRYCHMASAVQPVGDLLREWRRRRRLSQLNLATEAEISSRHLSLVETGRSHTSREMILRLCDYLAIPVRERNVLLVAAG